jgi:putative sigma-54 modulation protein
MGLTVTFRHLESNDALKKHAEEKISRIEKYFSNVNEVHVILSLEKRRHIAEIIVNVNKAKLTAKEVSEDNMYTAIDLVMDKIEKQVKKYKDKITNHKDPYGKAKHNIFESLSNSSKPNIIKTESIFIRSMIIDDAIEHIEIIDDDFLVFKNSETEKVNVIYKRRDGCLGLIEMENT